MKYPVDMMTTVPVHLNWINQAPSRWTYRESLYLSEIARQGYASANALDIYEMQALAVKIIGLA